MFYLKHNGKRLYIEDDNVYTTCPRCEKEHKVSLSDQVIDGELDLHGTSVYCRECSTRHAAKMVKEGAHV